MQLRFGLVVTVLSLAVIVAYLTTTPKDPLQGLVSYQRGHAVFDEHVLKNYYARFGKEGVASLDEKMSKRLTRSNYHSAGHAFGDVLYEKEGLDAVATCSGSFEFGCLHQVMGRAFSEFGESQTLSMLIERCKDSSSETAQGQCEHGVGHGVMFLGAYEPDDLDEMMYECDTITTTRPIPRNHSCHAGLMMEFNMHLMNMEFEGENGRPAPEHPFQMCERLSGLEHRTLCVWWAQPWLHGQKFDYAYDTATFAELGKMCAQIQDRSLQATCHESIGRSIAINGNKPAGSAYEWCRATSEDTRLQARCVERAIVTYGYADKPQIAGELCTLARQTLSIDCTGE